MDRQDQLLAFIQQLYAAPGTRDGWSTFLEDLCDAAGAVCAHFISVDRRHEASLSLTVRSDPDAIDSYTSHWGAHDPWGRSPTLQAAGPGDVFVDEQLTPRSTYKRTAYYNEFARRFDLVRSVVGVIEKGSGVISVISVGGHERHGPFGTDETSLVRALMPHLHRGLQLHRRLAAAEGAVDDFRQTLDQQNHAVILIDASGKVVFMNDAGVILTSTRDGLSVDEGELRASSDDATTRLRFLLNGARTAAEGQGVASGGTVILGRPSGRRPLVAVVAPYVCRDGANFRRRSPLVIVIVSDPERAIIPDAQVLREFFRLTSAEAALVRLLADGLTPAAAAARLGVRTETMRTRLKAVFKKTNTHGQVDLVRLLRAVRVG